MKVLLQDLRKQTLGWDQKISSDFRKWWIEEWLRNLPFLASFQLNSLSLTIQNGRHQISSSLHHFSDASEKSLGYASPYLCLVNEHDQIYRTLFMAISVEKSSNT